MLKCLRFNEKLSKVFNWKLILLAILVLVISIFSKGAFKGVVNAFSNEIKILPSQVEIETNDESIAWKNPTNILSQDLSSKSSMTEFDQANSAFIDLMAAGEANGSNQASSSSSFDFDNQPKSSEGSDEQVNPGTERAPVPNEEKAKNDPADSQSQNSSDEKNKSDSADPNVQEKVLQDKTAAKEQQNSQEGGGNIDRSEQNQQLIEESKIKQKEISAPEAAGQEQNSSDTQPTEKPTSVLPKSNVGLDELFRNILHKITKLDHAEAQADNDALSGRVSSLILSNFDPLGLSQEEQRLQEISDVVARFSLAGESSVEGEKLVFEYSVNGEWIKLGTLDLAKNPSNAANGNYYFYQVPGIGSWNEVNLLKIRISYASGSESQDKKSATRIFLDSAWLEVNYETVENSQVKGIEEINKEALENASDESRGLDNDELKLVSTKLDFRMNEAPDFNFIYKKKRGMIASFWSRIVGLVSGPGSDLDIRAKLIKGDGGTIDLPAPTINFLDYDEFAVVLSERPRNIKPGKYRLELSVNEGGEEVKSYQDFSWGVLALNTDRSIYRPGENGFLQFAVLDEAGHTVCGAGLSLSVIDPSGQKFKLTTDEKKIIRNPECGPDNVIKNPDYYAYFKFDQQGQYQLELTANTENGLYTVSDQVVVKEGSPFEVERAGPTRIYPAAPYQMALKVKFNEDFAGDISDIVPASFRIAKQSLKLKNSLAGENYYKIYDADFQVEESVELSAKKLVWKSLRFKKGDAIEIKYLFDAPDVSPEFYLLGPLQLGGFQENRLWQIASDAEIQFVKAERIAVDAGTTDTSNWTTALTASSTSFTAGNKYFIYVTAGFAGNTNAVNTDFEILFGTSTRYTGLVEGPAGNTGTDNDAYQISWFDVYTMPTAAATSVSIRYRTNSGTSYSMNVQIYAVNLSNLAEDDYKYSEETSSYTYTTTMTARANATLDKADGQKDWLVFGLEEMDAQNNNGPRLIGHIYDGAAAYMQYRREAENTAELIPYVLYVPFDDVATNTNFSIRVGSDGGGTHNVSLRSKIFALNLDAFETHKTYYADTNTAIDATPAWTEIANLNQGGSYQPQEDGENLVFASWIDDAGSATAGINDRLQINGETTPTGWSWVQPGVLNKTTYDATDEIYNNIVTSYQIPSSGYPITMYASEIVRNSQVADEVSMTVFSARLKHVEADAFEQYKSDGAAAIMNGGWTDDDTVNLQAYSIDAASSTSQVDFYFELIGDASSFTTATGAPTSYCGNGTAYESCGSKIWKASGTPYGWHDPAWLYRRPLTINAGKAYADLEGFPVLATTTSNDLRHTSSGGHVASSTGADLFVTGPDKVTPLPFEREYYNSTTGQVVLWIKADVAALSTTTLYLYYGNAGASQDYATTTGVWDDHYLAVHHMADVTTATINDSSKYSNDGTKMSANNPLQTASGQFDKAQDFSTDYISLVGPFPTSISEYTAEAWIKTDTVAAGTGDESTYGRTIMASAVSGSGYPLWLATRADEIRHWAFTGNSTGYYETASANLAAGIWYHVAAIATKNGGAGSAKIYVNGVEAASGAALANDFNANFTIGDLRPTRAIYFDGMIDEVKFSDTIRSAEWIRTEYANQSNSAGFISFGSESTFAGGIFEGIGVVSDIPDSSTGYKWQVRACESAYTCSAWNAFSTSTPNFKVDTDPPDEPGDLSYKTKTSNTISLNFGYQSVDANFRHYKIFYKEGSGDVSEADIEHIDANLGFIDYNGISYTAISGLQPDTQYTFNIWAYDWAGNKASATPVSITTSEPGRAKTVQFLASSYTGNGSIGLYPNQYNTLDSFNFSLSEDDVNIANAYIIFEAQYEAYNNASTEYTAYKLGFDACQEPCTANASSGPGRILQEDNTILSYYDNYESNQVRLLADVTSEAQIAAYTGGGSSLEGQVGFRLDTNTSTTSISNAKAVLVVTYTYDNNSQNITNTVFYPLESDTSSGIGTMPNSQTDDCTPRVNCPRFGYNFSIPEYSASPNAARISQWFQTYLQNDSHGGEDVWVDINIWGIGATSTTYIHEALAGGEQGHTPVMYFAPGGFAENTDQQIEYYPRSPAGAANFYLAGGEVAETYIASSSAATKTRTVSFPIGVVNNGNSTAYRSTSTAIQFPENGLSSGNVDIKKAWFRIISNEITSGARSIAVSSKSGNNAISATTTYNFNAGATVIKPSFNIIHVIPSADYSELESANAATPKTVYVNTVSSNADIGGVTAELMITYAYTQEALGYLANIQLLGGQSNTYADTRTATITTAYSVMPESDANKTMLAAGLLASYLISDSDYNINAAYQLDANMGVAEPSCVNSFYSTTDATPSFVELMKRVTSAMDISNSRQYIICLSNNGGTDGGSGGAKMNAQLVYTYQYYNPLPITISAEDQKKADNFTSIPNGGWTTENQVNLSANSTDSSSSTQTSIYFELVANSQSLSTSSPDPASACVSGTAFGGCTGKIWKYTASSSSAWYDSNWLYRKKLTVNASQVVADQSGFPVLATTTSASLAFSSYGGHMASSTAGDLVITDSDMVTPLYYEREYYSPSTGEIALWIKTDISSTTNKNLYLYYGNPGVLSDQSTTTGVWDDNYLAVWHMRNEGGVFADSKSGNNGTNGGTNELTGYGGIGYTANFNEAESDYINLGAMDSYENQAQVTMEVWLKTDGVANDDTILAKGGASEYYPFIWRDETAANSSRTNTISIALSGTSNRLEFSNNSMNNTNWRHFAAYFDGGSQNMRGYLDGYEDAYSPVSTGLSTFPADNNNLWVGRWEGSGYPLDGLVTEIRISKASRTPAWLKTEANNFLNGSNFFSFSSSEDSYTSQLMEGSVNIAEIPDSAEGYKWQAIACNEFDTCTSWDIFDTAPNFKVDHTPPTAPGNLSLATSTPSTALIIFGSASDEDNFDRYRIFYKEGLSAVSESDTELSDANLLAKDYNEATSTLLTGLIPSTQYVVNIWAYDLAGNKVSAAELQFMTSEAPHMRANSVVFPAGFYSANGTTGKNTNTDYTFNSFDFKLPENSVNIRDAYVIFEAQVEAYGDNAGNYTGYTLAFDACEAPCTPDAFSGTGAAVQQDTSVLAYDENDSNMVRLLMDVTSEAQIAGYIGSDQLSAQVGYRINFGSTINSIANAKAQLVVNYEYESDNNENYANTVIYPLESSVVGDSGARRAAQADDCVLNSTCPTFTYNVAAPEAIIKQAHWFQVYLSNDLNLGSDPWLNVNIQGRDEDSDTYIHESANGNEQFSFPMVMFNNVAGFATNTAQTLEMHAFDSAGSANYYLMGGEVMMTYIASTSAAVKTRTVSFPVGVLNNGRTTSNSSSTAQVYFPENGEGSGVVDVKKAWFRVVASSRTSGNNTVTISSKVGDNAQSGNYIYNFNPGGDVARPSFTIIHVIPLGDYAELESANADIAKEIKLFTTNGSANTGGVAAELLVTYSYTSETTGYLSSLKIYAGQSFDDSNSALYDATDIRTIFPELRGVETVRAGGLLAGYFMTDNDLGMPSDWTRTDAVISSTSTPVCGNSFNIPTDGRNAFGETYNNVMTLLDTTDGQAYNICYSNANAGDATAGAKMNGILAYTYQWDAPPSQFTAYNWRWYENADSDLPTTPKAAEKSGISGINIGDVLRLRMSAGVYGEDLSALTQSFKLQYGKGSDCMSVSDWEDVGGVSGTSSWIGYNNPEPADGNTLNAMLLSSSTVSESYEESNPSASNPNGIDMGEYGEWDWSIYNNNASSSQDYCFRMVKSSGTAFDSYPPDSYAILTTASSNTPPNSPTDLGQYKSNGTTTIPNASWLNEQDVKLAARAIDPNINEVVTLYYELITATGTFTSATSAPSSPCVSGTAYGACSSKIWSISSASGDYRTDPFVATASIVSIPENSSGYKWQVLACDDGAACSDDWAQFDTSPNFRIDTAAPQPPGSLVFATSTPTSMTILFGASSTDANFYQYRIYYKTGSSSVSEANNQHSDSNLNFIDYFGATSTTIYNLSAGTVYAINIWAYDLAGNKASASPYMIGTTTSSYTPPTGSFVTVSQKTNGSGSVDIAIAVDDPDNDDSLRAKIEYAQGNTCNFSTPLDPTIDPADENTTATYGDPKVDDSYAYQVGTTTGWIMTSPGSNFVFFDWLSKSAEDIPDANDTYCLRLTVNDGIFSQATSATRLLIVDNLAPTTPGALTLNSKKNDSVTLNFTGQSADTHFSRYRIYYQLGTSGASESGTEHADANLLAQNYNNAATTTISGLLPDTEYAFNIWAYDTYGNKASSTEINVRTNASPANAAALAQYKSDYTTEIANGGWTNDANDAFKAGVHDQNLNDTVNFYYEIIGNGNTFTTSTSVPIGACSSTIAYPSCPTKIWTVSTSTSEMPTDWYHKDWLYRKEIVISHSQVPADQTGFPVLATTTDSDLAARARPDGYDILFTDSSGTTTLDFQREYYASSTGQFIAWVQADISSTTDTVLYMYYGNSNNTADYSTSTGVWDSGYRGVWHLGETVVDESSQTGAHLDSTSNGLNADQYGNNEITAKAYRGQEFDGINDYIDIGNTGSNVNTVSFWIKAGNLTDEVMDFDGGGHTIFLSSGKASTTGFLNPTIYIDGAATTTIDTNWHYLTVTTATGFSASNLRIGRIGSGYFSGLMDELRISNAARSADWIRTEYDNQKSVAAFLALNSQESVNSMYQTLLTLAIPDSATGYKWQVMACDDDGDCSNWGKFNVSIPNFKVDILPPTAPGALVEGEKTSNMITLNFGASTTESNFYRYRVFYSTTSPATESSLEISDADLNYQNYNNTADTAVTGLQPNTQYFFNIWAYDVAGNKASTTETEIWTDTVQSSPGVIFYTRNTRVLYYMVWDGTSWGAQQSGPTLGSGATDYIRHIRVAPSDDYGKIAILAKTWDGTNQEWWATVFRVAANDFVNTSQLGTSVNSNTNDEDLTGCIGSLSGKEFFIVRSNNVSDGTLAYSWNSTDGWTSEGAGPNPVAVVNSCELIRRPGTDNYLLVTFDDDSDVGTSYYYGGPAYANSWTGWTQHSGQEQNVNNYVTTAFFDAADNTRGAVNYTDSNVINYTNFKKFTCTDNSISYAAASSTPASWTANFVNGDVVAEPGTSGAGYFLGRDTGDELNAYRIDITGVQPQITAAANGDNISGGAMYDDGNRSYQPFALEFPKSGNGTVLWNNNTSATPKYRKLTVSTNSLEAGDLIVPGAASSTFARVRTYNDPNEEEFLAVYQSTAINYSAVFWDGANDRFYNSVSNPGSSQTWTDLATGTGCFDADGECTAFSYAVFNTAPSAPTSLIQLKSDRVTTISNGGWTNQNQVNFRASAIDSDTSEAIGLYLQVLPNSGTYATSTQIPAESCASTVSFNFCTSTIWQIATSSVSDYSITPFTSSTTITGIPDSSTGYKWQVIACDDGGTCSGWSKFNATAPNFKVDATAPTAPGNLTVSSKNSYSATLAFGATTTESNFKEYRIYYATSTIATESTAEHDDADLDYINYNNTTNTTVINLASGTLYYFNIWAYDWAGNKASATIQAATTTSMGYRLDQTSFLLENDDGATVNDNTSEAAASTTLLNLHKGERLNARIQIRNYGGDIASGKAYKLQFQDYSGSPGGWQDATSSGVISYSMGLSGANGNVISTSKAVAGTSTWAFGTWHENTGTTNSYSLNYGYHTEFVFSIKTSNAVPGRYYRLRLYNNTDNRPLDGYWNYPMFSIASAETKRYSKEAIASLPTGISDLTYYLDPQGYSDVLSDDSARDPLVSAGSYAIFNFYTKNNNNSNAITATWNGQSSVAPSTRPVYLQVYKYGSPDQWLTVASNTTENLDTDFTLTASLNSGLSSYYGADNWSYWRVYQGSGSQSLKTDYFNFATSAPVAETKQLHFRWRNDNGSQTAATWREAEDLGDPSGSTVALEKGEKIRLRLAVGNYGGGSASNYAYRLEYATSSGYCTSGIGSWQQVTLDSTGHWQAATSSYYTNHDATTQQLSASGYTFTAGEILKDPSATSGPLSLPENYYTEVEYAITPTANANSAGTYCFRVTNNGTDLTAYDQYPIITLAGNTNIAPVFSVLPSDGGSDATNPTNYGLNITFSATAGDSQGDSYYLAVCKTNNITAGNDGPPSCGGGHWCISELAASSSEAVCAYNAADSSETLAWYAFACDKYPGFSIAKCSAMSQGQADTTGSPFVINHPPNFTAVTTVTDNQDPGSTFVLRTTSSDTDSVNGADTLRLHVCATNDASFAGCASTTICSAMSTSSPNAECYYTDTAPTPAGSNAYYAFVFDNHGLASLGNSRTSSYTIKNTPPTLGTASLNSGSEIQLGLKGAENQVVASVFSISDLNGCASLVSATSKIYFSNVTGGYNCASNDNDCYSVGVASSTFSDCSGGDDMIASLSSTAYLKYFAIPTDDYSSSMYKDYNWAARITVNDGATYVSTTSPGVELKTNTALDVAENTINFGNLLFMGDNSGAVNQTSTVVNYGNSPIKTNIYGTDLADSYSNIISVDNIEWNLDYFTWSNGTDLQTWGRDVPIYGPKPTSTADVYDFILWGIGVPFGSPPNVYNGQNTFTVFLDASGW